MRKLLLLFIMLIGTSVVNSQDKHTVLRGETLNSIANKYGLTVDRLKQENPITENAFYVGMSLTIPQIEVLEPKESYVADIPKKEEVDLKEANTVDSVAIVQAQLDELLERIRLTGQYWDEGDEAFAEEKYSKAIKKYTEALKIGGDDPDLFYNRGLCSLKKDKYNHAIKDFNSCLSNDPDDELRERAKSMLELAENLKEERSQRRGQIIAGVVLAAAGTALAVAEANAYQSYAESNYSPYSSNSFTQYSTPAYTGNDIYTQRDIYYNTEIAKSNMQMMQINAMRMELSRQQQNEANRVFQMKTEALSVSYEALSKYTLNPSDYSSPDNAFYTVFSEKMGRAPSFQEVQVFQDYYAGYISDLMERSGSGSSSGSGLSSISSSSIDSDYSFSSSSTWDYRAEYNQLENSVKEMFRTWTVIGGSSYESSSGETKVSIDASNAGGVNQSMFSRILSTQKEMAKVREEARKNGISIMASEWETKRPSSYY